MDGHPGPKARLLAGKAAFQADWGSSRGEAAAARSPDIPSGEVAARGVLVVVVVRRAGLRGLEEASGRKPAMLLQRWVAERGRDRSYESVSGETDVEALAAPSGTANEIDCTSDVCEIGFVADWGCGCSCGSDCDCTSCVADGIDPSGAGASFCCGFCCGSCCGFWKRTRRDVSYENAMAIRFLGC